MRWVRREELLDFVTWSEQRTRVLPQILEIKRKRRVHLGDALTLLFENSDTIRYQVQEMMRVERMVKEADIQHELATYNELLGGPGDLGATLLIEIDDPLERTKKLAEWLELPEHVFVRLEDGSRAFPRIDARQRGVDRLSAVQFFLFEVKGRPPLSAGVDMPGMQLEVALTAEQRAALEQDLKKDGSEQSIP
jgi:hypothetical protein